MARVVDLASKMKVADDIAGLQNTFWEIKLLVDDLNNFSCILLGYLCCDQPQLLQKIVGKTLVSFLGSRSS